MRTLFTITLLGCLASGCAMFRVSVDDKEPLEAKSLTAKYDQRDLLSWGEMMAQDLLAAPVASAAQQPAPIVIDMGIQNRTKTHMDLKALTDTITTKMLNSGKFRFVNSARRDDLLKEQGYQVNNCTPEARVQTGKQLGAKYMLTGSLTEIETKSGKQVRVSKKQDVYYQLTVELTDLETGLIEVRKQRDRLRRASKPIVGW